MSTKFMDMFDDEIRNLAVKVLAFYDGRSRSYLEAYLRAYRRNALTKGMQPRTINITKEIVDKSGMLFSGRPPTLNVYPMGELGVTVDDAASLSLQHLMERATWVEFFNNFDSTLRLLKTGLVFVQYDADTKEVFFTVLTRANCAVHVVNRRVDTLIYFTGMRDDVATYRIWTEKLVQDLEVTSGGGERITDTQPNPYGFIPIAVFHDTNIPRDGFWNPIPEDLLHINDIYNLHLTDGEYSISHAKMQTLFTNAQIQGGNENPRSVEVDYGSKLGTRWLTTTGGEGFVGGPGEAVALETAMGDSVYLEYKGPTPNIEPLDKVIRGWFGDYARGWSVTIETESSGAGAADSGFKLVVRQLPNMELRKKRQRMFEAGFRELYDVLLRMNAIFPLGLAENTVLFAEFSPPELPHDEGITETVWTQKIREGRASLIDYFTDQHGYSREEAEVKVKQLAQDKALVDAVNAAAGVTPEAPSRVTTGVRV